VGARDDLDAGGLHQLARLGLGAHGVDGRRGRADEDDAVVLQRAGERRVLGEEAVAGVDRLGARLLDDLEQLLDDQVALVRRPGTDQIGLGGAL
jgi:hypothetical protein